MILLAFVSSIFLIISIGLVFVDRYYKQHGVVISGTVYGIEKYVSRTSSGSSTRSQLMYRPIVQYEYEGETYYMAGSGRNSIVHKIGHPLKLRSLNRGKGFVTIVNNVNLFFEIIFGLIALVGFYMFIKETSGLTMYIGLSFPVLLPYGVYRLLKKKNKLDEFIDGFLQNADVSTLEELSDRDIFTSTSEIDNEERRTGKIGRLITGAFAVFVIWFGNTIWAQMPRNIKTQIEKVVNNEAEIMTLKQYIEEPKFIAFLFVIFLGCALLWSVFFQIRKSK